MTKEYTIDAETLQAVHDYLMRRPMFEVEALIVRLRQAKPVENSVDEAVKT